VIIVFVYFKVLEANDTKPGRIKVEMILEEQPNFEQVQAKLRATDIYYSGKDSLSVVEYEQAVVGIIPVPDSFIVSSLASQPLRRHQHFVTHANHRNRPIKG